MQHNLKLIGYWKSPFALEYEHPITFVDESWNEEERKAVILYLKNGKVMPYVAMGLSFCRFDCGIGGNGCLEKTDGVFVWPEGLDHYVEFHNIKLPEEFIAHCLKNEKITEINEEDEFTISDEWWISHKGPNQELLNDFCDPFDEEYPLIYRILFQEKEIDINKSEFLIFTKELSHIISEKSVKVYMKIKKNNFIKISLDNQQLNNIKKIHCYNLFVDEIIEERLKNEN